MLMYALLFLSGDLLLQQFPQLPTVELFIAIGFIICVSTVIFRRNKLVYFLAIFMTSFAWTAIFAIHHLHNRFPNYDEGKNILLTGKITSIPNVFQNRAEFDFLLQKINDQPCHGDIKLKWRYAPYLQAGEQWQVIARVKNIHGMMNPGGFDFEGWAFQEGLSGEGYIVPSLQNKLLAAPKFSFLLTQLRQKIKEKMQTLLPQSETAPWIIALALGERHNISQDKWDVLRNTGTNHLMAIAGLHIGFMSSFIFALVTWIWKRSAFLVMRFPAQHAGAIAALGMALLYSSLAGFSIPTQRACIMLSCFLIFLLLKRKIPSWTAWASALLVVLMLNPLSILTDSFWLSFGSVALIIYGVSARLNPHTLWWKLGRIQWVIAFGLIPLSIWLFQQASVVALLANSIAIPWVGFVIVPLTLAGCFFLFISSPISKFLLALADLNLHYLWQILSYLAHLSWSNYFCFIPNTWILLACCVGVILLLLPIGIPGRWLGCIWFLPLICFHPPKPKYAEAWLTLLDVGQGLSAVIQTQKHLLVFDTGAKLSDSYDMGNSIVVPFLRTLRAKKIDLLIISHGDNDHIGGSAAILQQLPVMAIKTSVPEKFTFKNTSYCLENQSWQWDGVNFMFLYPPPENLHLDNNSSCVLKVSTQQQAILLTGDIEKFAENYLIKQETKQLSSTILIAPHHGSKTSGEINFIKLVNPQYVLFPIGYRNRYHFPHPSVVETYTKLAVKQMDSVKSGEIEIKLQPNNIMIYQYRERTAHYWYNKSH